jgi:2-oxoglutarate dehydrogenase complex dehydrogenase (E1) component-like enzyme
LPRKSAEAEGVFEGYRRWGYLAANLDPLGFLTPFVHPELITEGPAQPRRENSTAARLARNSCTLTMRERRRWIAERLESRRRRGPIAPLSSND